MINGTTIERINDAVQIVDVITPHVDLKRSGSNYKACCPFHAENTPSFMVRPSTGIFKCFGCGKGGDAVTFIMEHQAKSYPDAIRYLAGQYNIQVEEHTAAPDPKHDERQQIRETLAAVQAHFTTAKKKKKLAQPGLYRRNIGHLRGRVLPRIQRKTRRPQKPDPGRNSQCRNR